MSLSQSIADGELGTPGRIYALQRVLDSLLASPKGREEEIDALEAAIEGLQGIDEADRRAGQALRRLQSLHAWMDLARQQAGYPISTPFNTVWNETLAMARRSSGTPASIPDSAPAVGAAPVDPSQPTTF